MRGPAARRRWCRGPLGWHPAGLVDAAQILLDELIHPEKYWYKVHFERRRVW